MDYRRFFLPPDLKYDREFADAEVLDNLEEIPIYDFYQQRERLLNLVELQKTAAPQKSERWKELRWNMVSASDVSCASDDNPFKTIRAFIEEKALPMGVSTFNPTAATMFGERYEPVCNYMYEDIHGVKLYHMNLVVHPLYPNIGASIDALAINEITKRINLVEFKAPKSRPPHRPGNPETEVLVETNHVKINYWMQTQVQMEVLDVPENDYFDVKIVEPPTVLHLRGRDRYYGYSFTNPDDPETYIYSHDLSGTDYERYEYEKPTGFSYWCAEYYHLATIQRSRAWFAGYLPKIQSLWNRVLAERRFAAAF